MNSLPFQLQTMAILAFCAIGGAGFANAEDIKIGSIIHLQNKVSSKDQVHFLDTQGRIQDHKALARSGGTLLVFTNPVKDRDKGSGSWKILSAAGKADGEPLAYGDEIHLENMYPNAGLLQDANWENAPVYGELFQRRGRTIDDYPVSTVLVSSILSSPWIVGGRNATKGATVQSNEEITLESMGHGNGASGYLLRAGIPASELPLFKLFKTQNLVFTSKTNFDGDTQFWIMIPKK